MIRQVALVLATESAVEKQLGVDFDGPGSGGDGRQVILPRLIFIEAAHFVLQFLATLEMNLCRQVEVQYQAGRFRTQICGPEADPARFACVQRRGRNQLKLQVGHLFRFLRLNRFRDALLQLGPVWEGRLFSKAVAEQEERPA